MVRSLKVIGTMVLSLVASGTAFSPPVSSAYRSSLSQLAAVQRDTVVMMPATIEKETVHTGRAPAVLERPQVDDPAKERKATGSQVWEVRIYNDSSNTREHVARSLVQVTGMSEILAYQTMMQAHSNGMAVIGRFVYEVAEMYHDQLRKNGIVCDIVPVDEEH